MNSARCCPPPVAATEPGFLRALEPATIQALAQQQLGVDATVLALHPDYVRWKDRDGSLVGYRAVVQCPEGELNTYLTVRTAAPHRLADEAERLQHRATEDHAGLRAFALVPAADVLLLAFPIDRVLPDLRRLVRASKLRSLVGDCCPTLIPTGLRLSKSRSHCQIVRYKPERRAVLHWDLGLVDGDNHVVSRRSLWVRCYAEAQASHTSTATAAAAAAGVACPTTLGQAHERLLLEDHLDGSVWQPFLPNANDAATSSAAATLAHLHDARLPASLPHHGPVHELDLVLRAAEDLARLDPQLGREAHRIADQLAHAVPMASAPVLAHGDLHPEQVLLQAMHGAGLVDFDRACIAPAALDLANLQACCLVADPQRGAVVARRFLAEYGRHRRAPAATELAWWTGCALVRSATTPFRRLQADWPAAAAKRLDQAAALLGAAAAREGTS